MRIVGNYTTCCGGFFYPNIPSCITPVTSYGETRDYKVVIASTCATPAAITGVSSVCVGGTAPLSNTTSGGTWSSSNTAIGTVSSTGVVGGIAAGSVTITYTVAGGCFVTKPMTINAVPTIGAITGSSSVCIAGTTALNHATAGGTWSSSASGIASVNPSGVVTGVSAGTATISYVVANICSPSMEIRTMVVTVSAGSAPITGIRTLCVGSTTTLANANSGGAWSSSHTTRVTVNPSTGFITGVSTGTTNITYTLGAGCSSIAQVTVHATLPGNITGAANVCVAGTTTFTHAVAGGVWTSSNTSLATVNPSTGIITGVAAGTPTITYNVAGGSGCFRTKSITVSAGSSASIAGNTTICQGTTTVLSYPTTGTAWSTSNPAVATIGVTSGVVTGVTPGTSTISFLGSTGCATSTVITILAQPTAISGSFTICQSAFVPLSSVGTTGGTWTSSNTGKATVGLTTGIVNGIGGGTAIITYTWTNTCKRTANITVSPLPVAGAIVGAGTVSVGSSVTLTPSSAGGTWASGNTARATVAAASGSTCTLTGVSAGTVVITYTNTNSCGSSFVTRIFNIVTPRPGASVFGSDAPFSVYPNPTSGLIKIEAPVSGVFTVYSIDSREVARYTITDATTSLTLPDHLASGIYMCRFNGNDGSTVMVRLVYEQR